MTISEYLHILVIQVTAAVEAWQRTRPRRQRQGGLGKRCHCVAQDTCAHAWHLEFYCTQLRQRVSARRRGVVLTGAKPRYRLSLTVLATRRGVVPPRTRTEAARFAAALRQEMRAGTFHPFQGMATSSEIEVWDEPLCCEGGPLELHCALCRRSPTYWRQEEAAAGPRLG